MLWRIGADPLTRRIGSLFSHLDGSLASAPALWRAMTGHARRQQPKSRGKGNGAPKPPKPPKPLNGFRSTTIIRLKGSEPDGEFDGDHCRTEARSRGLRGQPAQ